ncbi:MAG: diguanylate cyclase [Desulfobacterales bacterium]|nr:diguanylate cyclase [Desulfobacterales bacterium]
MVNFKNLPIKFKLFIPYALVFIVILSLTFSLLFFRIRGELESKILADLNASNRTIATLVETIVSVSIKNHLRGIAEKNREMVAGIYQDFEDGFSTEADARFRASRVLLSQSVGETGYIYCINSRGINVIHPNPSVWGQDFSLGKFSSQDFVKRQMVQKNGYLEYEWKNPNEASFKPKALYMSYFEPWDWIISVSSYREEFSKLVNIDDFKSHIMKLEVGDTGYSFILDARGNALIHPEWSGNIQDVRDMDGRFIIQEITRLKSGSLKYKWKDPVRGETLEKLIAFQYIPTLDWIVASGSYTREVFSSLYDIRRTFGVALGLALLVTAGVTLLISSTITRPLTSVITRFEKGAAGTGENGEVVLDRMTVDRRDEIGKLGKGFNTFMDQLETSRNTLMEEIGIRRETAGRLRLFEKVFENANDGIFITTENGVIENVNKAFTTITGYGMVDVVGKNPRILRSDHHSPSFYQKMWASLIDRGEWAGEIWNRRRSGEAYPQLLSISAIRGRDGRTRNYVAVFRDISDMKAKEEQIKHLAFHDPLTDLPNRSLLKDRLRKAISIAKRSQEYILILFIDLDDFKQINDSLGHAMGDFLLKEVARRLVRATREGDTVCRLGGDEFIVMAPQIRNIQDLKGIVERIQGVFHTQFELGGKRYPVSGSIGISVFPEDGRDVDRLIRNADLAMYQAKQTGKNTYNRFASEMASDDSDPSRDTDSS